MSRKVGALPLAVFLFQSTVETVYVTSERMTSMARIGAGCKRLLVR